jgi:hypothetical protein
MIPAITYKTSRVPPAKSARMNCGIVATSPLPPCSSAIFDAWADAAPRRQAPGDQRRGDLGPEPGDQDRAQDGEPETRTVVADGLGDAGGLTVGKPGRPVRRVRVGLPSSPIPAPAMTILIT